MKVLKNIHVLKKAIKNYSQLGFVPTMGGLHKGHISLIKESKKKCNKTLVSIFINPKQFNSKSDFAKYPRNLKKDLALLRKLNVEFVYLPKNKDLYKTKRIKTIKLHQSQKILCAKFRKGHFEGVLDIMDRFTNLIKPQYIFLGEKDFQQLVLVKNYLKNKYEAIIYPCKTIRDNNKLPLSTRNSLLTKKDLIKAGLISNILANTKKNIKNKPLIKKYLAKIKNDLIKKFNIEIEYLEVRNETNLGKYNIGNKYRIFISYYLQDVRLIDNF